MCTKNVFYYCKEDNCLSGEPICPACRRAIPVADGLKTVLGKNVKVVVDRPVGSVHPNHPDIKYELNYGYVPGILGGDGEEQDAYIMQISVPIDYQIGTVVAIIRRKNDVETKWVVAPVGITYTKEQIVKAVNFQEKYFDIEIIT